MKIIITGASSFIGTRIGQSLERSGHHVIPIGRSYTEKWQLGEAIPAIDGVDALIHLAHDRSRDFNQCISDAKLIVDSFEGRIIYISSLSAHPKSLSNYGKCKYGEELVFLKNGGAVIKAGIVADKMAQGVYGMLTEMVQKMPMIPLLLRGKSRFYISNIDDLVAEFVHLTENPNVGCFRGFGPMPTTFKQLIQDISFQNNLVRIYLPLPKFPFHQILLILRKFFPHLKPLDSYFSLVSEISLSDIQQMKDPKTIFLSSIAKCR